MDKLFEEVEEFVPEKFYKNLFDEMKYHGYEFKEQEVDEIVRIVFTKDGAKDVNVLILFHERENKAWLVARKNDFDQNLKRYISDDAETWVVTDSDDVKKSVLKHTKAMAGVEIIFRGKQTFIRNINNVITGGGYSIAEEKEIKALETMRLIPSFTAVAPMISRDDVACVMLRAKKGEFVRREYFDPTVKSFVVKFFLVY